MNVTEEDIDRIAGSSAEQFAELIADIKTIISEIRTIERGIRRAKNAASKEKRSVFLECAASGKLRESLVEPVALPAGKAITLEFAEFAGVPDASLMTEKEAMNVIAKYINTNALVSEKESGKIILDRKLKVLLEMTTFYEPTATYFDIQHNLHNVFVRV